MENYLNWIALVLGIIGLIMLVRGFSHIGHRHRNVRGMLVCCASLVPLLAGLLLAAVALGLHGYARLTAESEVLQLRFEQLGTQSFAVTISYPDGKQSDYILAGDDWRLEAQFLKWQGLATMLGAQPYYRLERLAGRYQDAQQELTRQRSVVELDDAPGSFTMDFDLWRFAREQAFIGSLVDASYGTATYLPMRDNVNYQVTVTNSGLLAREITPQ